MCKDGRRLFEEFSSQEGGDEFERAVRFFVLNRISFSGTTYSGGYSQQAFEKRFTDSSIERLRKAAEIIKEFKITHGDYEKLLFEEGEDVFIF
jgi:DNA adenine methylase